MNRLERYTMVKSKKVIDVEAEQLNAFMENAKIVVV